MKIPFFLVVSLVFFTNAMAQVPTSTVEVLVDGLKNPTSISLTNTSIYIIEQGENRVLELDLQGNVKQEFGNLGVGTYQFDAPIDVDASNGLKIYVSDYNNGRIQVFGKRGQILGSIESKTDFGRTNRIYKPTQIAVSNSGEIYFYDQSAKRVFKVSEDGEVLDSFSLPREVKNVDDLKWTKNGLLLLDKKSERVIQLSLNGLFERFIPTEGIQAISMFNDTMYAVNNLGVIALTGVQRSQLREIRFDEEIRQVALSDDYIYFLTPTKLLGTSRN